MLIFPAEPEEILAETKQWADAAMDRVSTALSNMAAGVLDIQNLASALWIEGYAAALSEQIPIAAPEHAEAGIIMKTLAREIREATLLIEEEFAPED